jgi:glucose-1-phosphate thymidylyltransferase
MAIVGIVPAAGYAERLQPLPCSKEMLRVGGRPVIDYLVERMRAGGCHEVRVVTRPEKADVVAHADRLGALVVRASPQTISESVAAGLQGLAADDTVLLGFPDTLWDPMDGFTRLVRTLEAGCAVALGLFRTPDLQRSDVVSLGDAWRVLAVEVKPAVPRSPWMWGCAAARAWALAGIEATPEPGYHVDALCKAGLVVVGVPLSDAWLDIGTHEALALAEGFIARAGR